MKKTQIDGNDPETLNDKKTFSIQLDGRKISQNFEIKSCSSSKIF